MQRRIALARQVEDMPAVGQALENGTIGFESAMLVLRVAGKGRKKRELARQWVERASVRTAKHLREEVEVVESAVRLTLSDEDLEPPGAKAIDKHVKFRASWRGLLYG